MRLIDADALVRRMEESMERSGGQAYERFAFVRAWAIEAPTVLRWIPCAEQMPEYDEEVLVDYLGHVRLAARSRNNEDYPWYLITTRFSVKRDHVKAWMPLPEPYRKEAHDV